MNSQIFLIPALYAFAAAASALMPSSWRKARGAVASYAALLSLAGAVIFAASGSVYEFSGGWFPASPYPLPVAGGLTLRIDFPAAVSCVVMSAVFLAFYVFASATSTRKRSVLYLAGSSAAFLCVMAGDFFSLLIFWGTVMAVLYLVLQDDAGEDAAQRALVAQGAPDFAMLLGIALMGRLSGTYSIDGAVALLPPGKLSLIALSFVAFGAAAKTGAMPFHNWIISSASRSSVPTLIIFPAVIDKVLGIYLLVRILPAMMARAVFFQPVLVIFGALTLILGVLKALAQHDLKRLLAYHSVSQVGYMILGLASFNPLGVLGGILHMFNNVVYKSGLFMGAGAVEKAEGTSEMSQLGALAGKMPATFGSMLVSSLAISGVPPLNGFVSKWLIFQGLLMASSTDGNGYILAALFAAMAGSSLTMASFLKVIHSVFLARRRSAPVDNSAVAADSNAALRYPQLALAAASVAMGAFAPFYIGRAVPAEAPLAALLMLAAALMAGVVIYQFKVSGRVRRTEVFFGGEEYRDEYVFGGGDFYKTVEKLKFLAPALYSARARSREDAGGFYAFVVGTVSASASVVYFCVERAIYLLQLALVKIVEGAIFVLRLFHTGELYVYLAWYLLGSAALFWILVR